MTTLVEVVSRSAAPREVVIYVLEELLSCLDLRSCPRLRVTYGGPVEQRVAQSGTPSVHIVATERFGTTDGSSFDVLLHDGVPIPAIGKSGESPVVSNGSAIVTFDLVATAFYFLAGRDYSSRDFDDHVEHPYAGSVLGALRSSVPPVNAALSILADAIRRAGGDARARSQALLCVASLGPMARPQYPINLRRKRSSVVTEFVNPKAVPAVYRSRADEVALHATDLASIEQQLESLTARVDQRPSGVRVGALPSGLDSAIAAIDAAGLLYDCSVTYQEAAEFATGFTHPHRLFDFAHMRPSRFIEIPVYADTHALMHHLRASARDLNSALTHGADLVAKQGGTLATCWNPDALDASRGIFSPILADMWSRGLDSRSMRHVVDERRVEYTNLSVAIVPD